jgi:small conductance mechanosensitive channel
VDSPILQDLFGWFKEFPLQKILIAILLLAVGIFIAQIVRRLFYKISIKYSPEAAARNTSRVIYYILVIIFAISAVSYLGVDVSGFLVAGGVIGIIVGFALQNITANFVSALFLYMEKPFSPGDTVEVGSLAGTVIETNVFSTVIRGYDGVLIRVPNQSVFQANLKNLSKLKARRVELSVRIAYKEDVEKAKKVLMDLLDRDPLVLAVPPPLVFLNELEPSGMNLKIFAWTPTQLWFQVYTSLLWKIKKTLTEAGIEISFIQTDVWFKTPLRIEYTDKVQQSQ